MKRQSVGDPAGKLRQRDKAFRADQYIISTDRRFSFSNPRISTAFVQYVRRRGLSDFEYTCPDHRSLGPSKAQPRTLGYPRHFWPLCLVRCSASISGSSSLWLGARHLVKRLHCTAVTDPLAPGITSIPAPHTIPICVLLLRRLLVFRVQFHITGVPEACTRSHHARRPSTRLLRIRVKMPSSKPTKRHTSQDEDYILLAAEVPCVPPALLEVHY